MHMYLKTICLYVFTNIDARLLLFTGGRFLVLAIKKLEKQDFPYPEESLSSQPHTPHPNWPPANNNDIYIYMYIYTKKLYIHVILYVLYACAHVYRDVDNVKHQKLNRPI